MEALWSVVFWAIPVWVFLFIPFTTFYYEADDGMLMAGTAYSPNPIKRSRIGQAACYQIFALIIVFLFFPNSLSWLLHLHQFGLWLEPRLRDGDLVLPGGQQAPVVTVVDCSRERKGVFKKCCL